MKNNSSIKKNLLASATIVAIAGSLASGSALASSEVTRGLGPVPSTTADQSPISRLVVTYRDGSVQRSNNAEALRSVTRAATSAGINTARMGGSPRVLRQTALGGTVVVLPKALDRVQAETLKRQLASDINVASVEFDVRERHTGIRPTASDAPAFIPNDPSFAAQQWHLKAPDGTPTPVLQQANRGGANVTNAWDVADGNGIVIAVIDTGITAHPDLDTSLADAGYDFIYDGVTSGRRDGNGNFVDGRAAGGWDLGDWTDEEPWITECTDANNPPSTSSWHGTHVAGTAGAQITNNGVSLAGVAYGAKVLPIRALGHCGGWSSDINDAILWAAGIDVPGVPTNANPAQVINMSLGGGGTCTAGSARAEAIRRANERGAVVVVAAGNHNGDAGNRSPASCPGVITVASNGVTGKRAFYSGYGSTIEISAPGGGAYMNDNSSGSQANPDGFVWQAVNGGDREPLNDGQAWRAGMIGTSMASPHVAGVVALMQGARLDAGLPLLTPVEVTQLIQQTATPFPSTPSQPIGPGIINAHAAVQAAVGTTPDPGEPGEPGGPQATELTNKVALTNQSGGDQLYSFVAEAGKVLTIMTYGGSGNVGVYVKQGAEPSTTDYQAFSNRAGNSETVRITAPTAGTYYIKLTGTYSGVSVVARQ